MENMSYSIDKSWVFLFFLFFLSLCTILAIKRQLLFIYFSYLGSKGPEWWSGGVKWVCVCGGGMLWVVLVHKAWLHFLIFFFVHAFMSWWLSEGPGCLEFPPTTTTSTQIPLLWAQLHRSHNLACPLLLPQANDSRARPLHKATAFSTSCTVHRQTCSTLDTN